MDRVRAGINWAPSTRISTRIIMSTNYTTGISAAHALLDRVTEGGAPAVADYSPSSAPAARSIRLTPGRDGSTVIAEPIERAFAT
jgi:hypothetical protein